ncbi:VOC family protein [Streptomyces sp. NPDC050149]|uniref:VOC family protein n=1 Tax=Streptomyces sp. NPDC050149 TaxID=3365603 RepID=UPI0037A16221
MSAAVDDCSCRTCPRARGARGARNSLRLDIRSEPGGLDELLARMEDLGAPRVREVNKGPAGHWWVMQDPEGNEFCVA